MVTTKQQIRRKIINLEPCDLESPIFIINMIIKLLIIIFWIIEKDCLSLLQNHKIRYMKPKIGDRMKVSPQLTDQADWIDGEVIDVEHNPFMGLVISIKDKLGRIFFGQSRYFIAL